ncbi:MAG: hypothetical protein RLY20_235, partial [Verrucomicrobiota bacterium]
MRRPCASVATGLLQRPVSPREGVRGSLDGGFPNAYNWPAAMNKAPGKPLKVLLLNQTFHPDVMATAQYLTELAVR